MDHPFLEGRRDVTFDWHMNQVLDWLSFDAGRKLDSVVVYTSLELRCAIERFLYDFLTVLKGGALPDDEEEVCRTVGGVFSLMQAHDPIYRKTVRFSELIASMGDEDVAIPIVDTDLLWLKWFELGKYIHKQVEPEATFDSPDRAFQEAGFALIDETLDLFALWDMEEVFGFIHPATFPTEAQNVWEKFSDDSITEEQALGMLRLMEPVLRRRFQSAKDIVDLENLGNN